jgi:antitoxin component YwqK of YwqJK toxin-antitoxin module
MSEAHRARNNQMTTLASRRSLLLLAGLGLVLFAAGVLAGLGIWKTNEPQRAETGLASGCDDSGRSNSRHTGSRADVVQATPSEQPTRAEGAADSATDGVDLHGLKEAERSKTDAATKVEVVRRYYDDGGLAEECEFVAGMKDGVMRLFYPGGVLRMSGSYRLGNQHGTWRWYYEDGYLERMETFEDGELQGPFSRWSGNGTCRQHGSFLKGKRHGVWEFRRSDGSPISSGEFANGVTVGLWTYYKDGSLMACGRRKGRQLDGLWQYFFPNGQLQATGNYSSSKKVGKWTLFHQSGEKRAEGDYGDKKDYTSVHFSGALPEPHLSVIAFTSYGDKSGVWNHWAEDGSPMPSTAD